ncbi:hypothetical protein KDH83_27605 [Achromobacter sp. Marseille-Q0513]|uniref:hypothetical protein n=1 Tax=Achromobacter sp. Marseille-Q0513 TaxID=2829161 RepID=UPI001B971CF6|nr:hypothetical protein [Achromobacter sp. Marseille-Q0513]MBR8657089.1 hypothetical protein [Achromobacter sp. Marseille-Q0513]
MEPRYLQKILFGPPGCGKSHAVRQLAQQRLGIAGQDEALIEATFHPEYGYGDFVAKLLPQSRIQQQEFELSQEPDKGWNGLRLREVHDGARIEYRIHAGPLLKALARAYTGDGPVLLAIDEINRGNCAQIFGDMFQLLDRDAEGWSQYAIDLSDLHRAALEAELERLGKTLANLPEKVAVSVDAKGIRRIKLRLPPQLSLIGTMNTSDESVYYMDTAFKRRWDFEHMPWQGAGDDEAIQAQRNAPLEGTKHRWIDFLERLNDYIAERFAGRNVDDKQVGLWFLRNNQTTKNKALTALRDDLQPLIATELHSEWAKVFAGTRNYGLGKNLDVSSVIAGYEDRGAAWPGSVVHTLPEQLAQTLINDLNGQIHPVEIPREAIRNKLMFFLWDNVFSRDSEPLAQLVLAQDAEAKPPRTFGDFATDDNLARMIDTLMAATPAATQT